MGGQEQDHDADGAWWWGWQGVLCSVLSGTWNFQGLGWDEQPELIWDFPSTLSRVTGKNE